MLQFNEIGLVCSKKNSKSRTLSIFIFVTVETVDNKIASLVIKLQFV